MGIIDRIFEAFVKPGANLPEEGRSFISSIATAEIWVLAVGIRGTPSIPRMMNAATIEAIAGHRIDVSEIGDDDSVFPFNYEEGGIQLLPFFTAEEGAKSFASATGPSVDGIFQPYPLLAGFVAAPENSEFDLILDPNLPGERRISREERRLLRTLSVAGQRGSAG